MSTSSDICPIPNQAGINPVTIRTGCFSYKSPQSIDFQCQPGSIEKRVAASGGYDLPAWEKLTTLKTWAEEGPPK